MRYLEPLVILEDSSNLKELRLSGTLPRACRPPLQTLTTFHIRLCEGQDCMDLRTFCEDFSNLKSLVTLVLEGPVVDCKDVGAGGDEFPHTVELPLLTTLVIDCRTCLDFYLAPLLDTLYLPILHTLVLRINDTEEWKSKLVGLNDMPLKFSALRTLHLESLTSIEFLSPLSIRNPFAVAFSEITSLVISHCTRKLLTNIRGFRGGSRPRWLKLRTLTIAFVWFVGDWDQFIEDVLVFVRSLRANGGSPIETLRLTCRDIMQDRWAVDSIRTELEEDGVRVEAIPADALDKGYEQWIPRGFREVSLPAEPEDLWAYVNE
ncbi:hypothetical protein PLICRDRAFT_187470 [Plicaturopsis crispa FD-325 SS-3]|nr:hypothetical protein PLICRDRAFT_187470 [Plicaturopsis crispa FD-325 SS-3]